ncbi:MAG: hypothetical protein IPK19_01385 [Chloroflexi bacterium]|nr:hypothetical protein [Chloroflexota bacterium]
MVSLHSFSMSHDELAWLLLQMALPPRLGMGETLYPRGSDPKIVEARLTAGGTALMARGWVRLAPDGKAIVDDMLVAGIGGTALAERAALGFVQEGERMVSFAYYFHPTLNIAHRLPAGGIHTFTMANSADEFVTLILEQLGLNELAPADVPELALTNEFSEALSGAARAGESARVEQLLNDLDLDAVYVQQIGEVLLNAARRVGFVTLATTGPTETGEPRLSSSGSLVIYDSPYGALCLHYMPGTDDSEGYALLKPYHAAAAAADLVLLNLT